MSKDLIVAVAAGASHSLPLLPAAAGGVAEGRLSSIAKSTAAHARQVEHTLGDGEAGRDKSTRRGQKRSTSYEDADVPEKTRWGEWGAPPRAFASAQSAAASRADRRAYGSAAAAAAGRTDPPGWAPSSSTNHVPDPMAGRGAPDSQSRDGSRRGIGIGESRRRRRRCRLRRSSERATHSPKAAPRAAPRRPRRVPTTARRAMKARQPCSAAASAAGEQPLLTVALIFRWLEEQQ